MFVSPFVWYDGEHYYDTVTRTKSKSFLNIDSLENRLFRNPRRLQLTLISTWSCNLRCPHCFVLKRLNKDFEPEMVDIPRLNKFIDWHRKKFNTKSLFGLIIGGEPFLYPGQCLEYASLIKKNDGFLALTTNLSLKLTDEMLEVYDLLDTCQVSLDGPELIHNISRRIYNHKDNVTNQNENVFRNACDNLKILKQRAKFDKIHIAISARKDRNDFEAIRELVFVLKCIGVSQITISYVSESAYFTKLSSTKMTAMKERSNPCCSFRYMEHFLISGNAICSDYFDTTGKSQLGTLDMDNYDDLESAYRKVIERTMPILQDKTCLQCNALPICWGQCVGHTLFNNFIPSKFCDQPKMNSKLAKLLQDTEYLNGFTEDAQPITADC